MIVTKLVGGLGNQMFQYAAGRALAHRHGTQLYIDKRSFGSYKVHEYSLGHFSIDAPEAPVHLLPNPSGDSRIYRFIRAIKGGQKLAVVQERSFTFDPETANLSDDVYLEGYWQSERYFEDVAQVIRSDFEIKTPQSQDNQEWQRKIERSVSVSIHVRRGDYVTNLSANKVHGTCPLSYYKKAIDTLRTALNSDIVLYVFSDDPDWVKANMDFDGVEQFYIDNNPAQKNYEDLRLMASCQHNIIANSTFSWWGAWLNPSPNKIVVAPALWFQPQQMNDVDLIPKSWIRV